MAHAEKAIEYWRKEISELDEDIKNLESSMVGMENALMLLVERRAAADARLEFLYAYD